MAVLLHLALSLGLVPLCSAAALPVSCGSIYKSFADCLVTLGDSLGDTRKDSGLQDIDAICSTVPPSEGPATSDETNQETLKGHGSNHSPASTVLVLVPLTSLLMVLLKA
ncbi:hypothetical protein CRUP_010392 [Coryphaenoides rupestris]|nr:hypothetical protein CRUP_010392 [Coryphaenoides rupestris]